MTPKEISGRMTAYAAQREREQDYISLLAWYVGNYTAIGFHSPKKYPKRPPLSGAEKKQTIPDKMSEEEMKNAMREIMAKYNK